MIETEFLQRLAGDDVVLSGGLGGSRYEPIMVKANDHVAAAQAEYRILRGLMSLGGYLWRQLGVEYVDGGDVLQRKSERIEVTDTEIITETVNHYFIREGLGMTAEPGAPPVGYLDGASGIRFPAHFAWLHFEEDEQQADGSRTLRYGAPEMKATVFICPAREGEDERALDHEMNRAINEILTVHGQDAIEHDWGRNLRRNMISFAFIPKWENLCLSVIHLYQLGAAVVKVRVTFKDEPFMRRVWQQVGATMNELLSR